MKSSLLSLPRLTLLFALLGLVDLTLTWYLLQISPDQFYEGNFVAQWWLERYGLAGLVGYKGTCFLLVVAAAILIARYRPRRAALVLAFACTVTAVVVGYSCLLLKGHLDEAATSRLRSYGQIVEQSRQLDERVLRMQTYYRFRRQLAEDVIAGRSSFEQAATRLATAAGVRDFLWQAHHGTIFPAVSEHELAVNVLRDHINALISDTPPPTGSPRPASNPRVVPTGYTASDREIRAE